jgi:hypothetical protein
MNIARRVALAAATALLLAHAPARPQAAASPVYDVEIIVFANPGGAREEASSAGRAARNDTGDRATGAAQAARFVGTLPAGRLKLGALRDRLAAGGAYRVIAHAGWSQVPASWGSRSGLALPAVGVNAPGLSGQVQLERGTYLHLGFTLRYQPPGATSAQELVEMRRVKFNERHYYDHPAFGVIAVVSNPAAAR